MHVKKIRAARRADLAQVIEIDALITGLRKPAYWTAVMKRYGGRFFLVLQKQDSIEGYIVGEIRDWEFGAPPCGWVFGLGVRPQSRLAGIGSQLREALCQRFRRGRVDPVRTLLARANALVLAFFRSQGMMAAPFMALEKRLD
jgi:GNAT superfamily N-acetyltransferase